MQFYWDAGNQLDSVLVSGGGFPSERVDYRYDPYGRLVLRTATDSAPSTERLYLYGAGSNSSNITKEVDLVSGNTTEYEYAGIDHPTMSVTRNSAGTVLVSRTYMMDGLGNVVGSALDGSNGPSDAAIIYDSWGNVQTDSTAFMRLGRLRFGFKGMLYDETTGLYNARARWYQPDVGRFMSEDPLGLAAGINQYAFAADDPIDASDPSGLIIPYSLAGVDITAKADPDPGAIDPPSIMVWLSSLFGSGGGGTGSGSAKAQAPPKPPKECSVSLGLGGAIGAPVVLGVSVFLSGTAAVGITSTGGIFFQASGALEGGIGAFVGGGTSYGISRGTTIMNSGVSSGNQVEANLGWGPALGGSVATDGNGNWNLNVPANVRPAGAGLGAELAAGPTRTFTAVTPRSTLVGRVLRHFCP